MKNINLIIATIFLAFLAGLLLLPITGNAFFGPWASKFQTVQAENGIIRIPIKSFDNGKAHYFTFKAQGKDIKFFVLKSRDGIIRAAFDACDVCFPEKKGYSQSGDFMICQNCGQKFHSVQINVIKGGCNPAPLRRTEKGQDLIISAQDIFSGYRYF